MKTKQEIKDGLEKMIEGIVNDAVNKTVCKFKREETFKKGEFIIISMLDEKGEITALQGGEVESDEETNPMHWVDSVLNYQYGKIWKHSGVSDMVDETVDLIINLNEKDPEASSSIILLDFSTKMRKFVDAMFRGGADKSDFAYKKFKTEEAMFDFLNEEIAPSFIKRIPKTDKERLN